MLDPIVAHAYLILAVAGGDLELSESETLKAAELLAARFGVDKVNAALSAATQLASQHGSVPSLEMALATLDQSHPDKASRAEIVRECIMVAGADDVSTRESHTIGLLMQRWGLAESDFSVLDAAAARVLLFCLICGADGAQDGEGDQALALAISRIGVQRMESANAEARAVLERHDPGEALMLAIRALSAVYRDRASRIAIARDCAIAAAADGTISKPESAALVQLLAAWGLTPQDLVS